MLNFIIPEDGSLALQELQYLKVKKGSNINLDMGFYKDRFKLYPWNLASAGMLNFRAKRLKSDTSYIISKDKDSSDWDKTDAVDGVLNIVLNSTDIAAQITGNRASFTGIAGDKLKITVDGVVYDNIDISAAASIADVAALINAAAGVYVYLATVSGDGYLVLTSPTLGGNSMIVVADGTNTVQTVVGRAFGTTSRSDTGEYGDLSRVGSLYCEVEFQPNGSSRVYKTDDFVIDIVEDVES